MRHLSGVILVAVLTARLLFAAQAPTAPPDPPLVAPREVPARQLALRTGLDRERVVPGATVTLIVDIVPRPRMHVYAPDEPDYIPIALVLDDSPLVRADPAVFPPSQPIFLPVVNARVRVYARPFRIRQPVTVAASAEAQRLRGSGTPLTVSGTLTYQACDDSVCYRPESVALQWSIPLAARP